MQGIIFDVQRFTYYGTDGNDKYSNTSSSNAIYTYAGNDSILNSGSYTSVYAGDDNDTISNRNSDSVYLDGGAGNDKISIASNSNWGWHSTIKGGTGNDTIYGNSLTSGSSYGDIYIYSSGDGFDLIYGYTSYDTISITGTSYYTSETVGSNVVLNLSNGAITLNGAKGKAINVATNSGSGYTSNYTAHTTITGTPNNDVIANYANYVSISGGAGNDSIYHNTGSWGSSYVTVNAGAGNDTIIGRYGDSSISGGDGNDVINLSIGDVDRATVNGGAGNDIIYNDAYANYDGRNLFQYASGDGNDTIFGVKASDTLHISSGSISNVSFSGNDAVLQIGSGSINLKNIKNQYFYLKNGSNSAIYTILGGGISISNSTSNRAITTATSYGDTIYNTGSSVSIYGYGGDDSIYNSGASSKIDAGDGSDTISNYANYVSISGGAGNDSIYHNTGSWGSSYVTVNAGAGNDTIIGRYGDSSISGGDGNDVINLSIGDVDRATVNGGAGNDIIYSDGYSGYDGRNLFQYKSGDGNDTIYGFKNSDTLSISGGSYTTTQSGSDLIYNVGSGSVRLVNYTPPTPLGVSITNSTSNVTLNGTAYNDTIQNIYSGGGDYVLINAGAGNDTIYNDYGWQVTINAGDGDDTITVTRGARNSIFGGAGNDRISLGTNSGAQTIRGGTGNDTIYGSTSNSYGVVYHYVSGDGNDVIYNFHSNDTITGATYTSMTSGSNVILNMSGGGIVTLANVTVPNFTFTEGADSYSNTTANTLLSARGGNDTINNSASRVTLYADDGDDKISNTGLSLSAYGGTGNDTIYNSGDYSNIDLGDGADSLYAYDNDYVTVNGGAGNDTINGSFYVSRINGGAGVDRISVAGGTNTVDGGDGDDSIIANSGSIYGGAGNDRISLSGNYSGRIVRGGTGNDSIYGVNNATYGTRYEYVYGDGSDIIYNYNGNDTISIAGTSQYTTLTSGSNKIVSVIGSGAMTLSGASSTALSVVGGTYVPYDGNVGVSITNSTSYVTLNGTAYNDTIQNIYSGGGDFVLINAGAGNDTIYNNYGWSVTMNGGDGNDTITSTRGSSNSIFGGAGNDVISLSSSSGLSVVKGGTGNDTVYGDTAAHLYQYENGDGYDVISGYNSNDTITITGGAWSKSTVGNDVIISVTNTNSTVQTGAITLSGAKGKTLNIYPTVPATVPPDTTVTQQEVIQKFMEVLDNTSDSGLAALNQAVSIASGGYFSNAQAAIDKMVSDCRNVSNSSTFLINYCGINLNNSDTGAITGSDAGGSTTKTAQSIVPENGSLNNFTSDSFTSNGLNVQLSWFDSDINPYNQSFSNLSNNVQKYIWQALQTWWVPQSLNLIAESYGNNFGFSSSSSATIKKIYFGFVNDNNNTLATTWHWSAYPYQTAVQLAMTVNMKYYNSMLNGGNVNGETSTSGAGYLDRTLAHEFTHAVMAANIDYFRLLPQFIKEGMAELTHGIDDQRTSSIRQLAGTPSNLASSLDLYNLGTGTGDAYSGGYMFLRYFAKQVSDRSSSSSNLSSSGNMSAIIADSNNSSSGTVTTQRGVTVNKNVMTVDKTFDDDMIDLATYATSVTKVNATALTEGIMIVGNTKANSIGAGKGNDTISGNTGNDTLKGGNGNDILYGDAGNDRVYGDAGDDTISGGGGKDTLYGGAGKDVFVYQGDDDFIADYVAGQDKIKIVEGSITSASISGSNIVFEVGSYGNITVKSGKGKEITVVDSDGTETSSVYPLGSAGGSSNVASGISVKGAALTASAAFVEDTIDLADYPSVTKVTAATLAQNVNILGNALANTVKSGKGDDSISGEAGDDALYGGAGNDVISGGAGNDKLYGEAGDDTISGGAGKNTLSGGAGADVFVYGGGNDFIDDYAAGEDKIKIVEGSISSASISGSNVVLKIGSGNITVKGAKSKEIAFIDSDDKEIINVYPNYLNYSVSRTEATIAAGFTGTLTAADYDSSVSKIDASALSKANIFGNAQNNTILGSKGADTIHGGAGADYISGAAGNDKLYGDTGDDTLAGGAGNDTLTGSAGNDVFVYGSGDGKDVITDYTANADKIKISSGEISSTTYSGNNVVFKIGSGTLTVQNAKGKDITIIDSTDKEITQTYSGAVSGTSKLFVDDNFIGGETQLDDIAEITADNYSVGKISATDYQNLAQDEKTYIVSAEK